MIKHMTPSEVGFQVGDRSVTVDGEALMPSGGRERFVVYAFSIKGWNAPHQNEPMTDADKRLILDGLQREISKRNTDVEIEDEEYLFLGRSIPASVPAGQACSQTGFWFTPAKAGSRRHFQQGELMPGLKSDWGDVIWQWDQRQDPPPA